MAVCQCGYSDILLCWLKQHARVLSMKVCCAGKNNMQLHTGDKPFSWH
jgi:hypothetical protein